MGYVHCCGALRNSRTFIIESDEGFVYTKVDLLKECPVCGHCVLQLTRFDEHNRVITYILKNKKALKFFEKIKNKIIKEESEIYNVTRQYGRFYLNYSEYGTIKKCYSNLRTMKLGLF